jgi:type IV pilus assembly protein PilY1
MKTLTARAALLASALITCPLLVPLAHAATDLADAPLTTTQVNARPNLMFILDDSGSMSSEYMPENINDWSSYTSTYGYKSSQCNGLAYNPAVTYTPPSTPILNSATGAAYTYPSMSASSAFSDGYLPGFAGSPSSQTSSTTVDMSFSTAGVSKIFTVGSVSGFATGNTALIRSRSNSAHWMTGSITAIDSTNKRITVLVTFSTVDSSVSYSSWTVGYPSTTNLSSATYYTYSGSQPRMNWVYSSSGAVVNNTFQTECKVTTSYSSSVFSAVTVSSLSSAQQTNYANWYSYYRKRILAVKAAAGQTFSGLSDNIRVGFSVISDPKAVSGNDGFLPVDNFTSTQKINFFSSMYNATPGGSTPLRGALTKAGRYYANVAPGQDGHLVSGQSAATADPVQYTCQRNYSLLSTDGYWNTSDEDSSWGYGPYKQDGTTLVGQQDGYDVRPQYDGSVTTNVTTYSVGTNTVTTYPVTITTTTTYPSNTTKTTRTCSTGTNYGFTVINCTDTSVKGNGSTTSSQSGTRTVTSTSSQTETVTTVNGTVTSDTFSSTSTSNSNSDALGAATTPVVVWNNTSSTSTSSSSCYPLFANCSSYVNGTSYSKGNTSTSTVLGTGTLVSTTPFKTQTNSTTTTSGYSNSLSDVAEYYYVTPVRTDPSVNCVLTPNNSACKGDLSPAGRDNATYLHMTTFTLGLGVNGGVPYDSNYLAQVDAKSGAYYNLVRGTDDAGNTVNWPAPYDTSNISNDVPGKIDDLWHAAVNGRGQYFSASDNAALVASLTSMLTTINSAPGYAGSAAASSLKPILGEDLVFLASYITQKWNGDVKAYTLARDASGDVMPVTQRWSAATELASRTYTTRNIYFYGSLTSGGTTTTGLVPFTYANLNANGLGSLFTNFCSKSPVPSQCASMSSTTLSTANDGTNLVNFLRGDRSNEISTSTSGHPYRYRYDTVLGDIINASPVYVGAPPFSYTDEGYATFKNTYATRAKTVYAAANDGMLHAFSADSADGGSERWAYVPSPVMSNLWRLADSGYADGHRYFVDGTPVIGDVYDSTHGWRTILVGGLNKGGMGYYALDVTDPNSPQFLWQFTHDSDADLGYTYGTPVITKVLDPDDSSKKIWAVLLTSGYNNTEGSGTGVGALYVINANTGALIRKIRTTTTGGGGTDVAVGSTSEPNGLSKINVWIDNETDNFAKRVYGGDLLGNIWRFDVNGTYEPNYKSLLLAKLATQSGSGGTVTYSNVQPITARPELAELTYGGAKYALVMVGTGKLLGQSDLTDTSTQGIYAIRDPLGSTGWGAIQGDSRLVSQSFATSADGTERTIATPVQTVNWASDIGWTLALPTSKERVAIDMNLQYSTLGVISHIPEGSACSPSGKSWVYFLNIKNGAGSTEDTQVGTLISSGLGTGMTWFDLGDGTSVVLVPDDKMGIHSTVPPVSSSSTGSGARRTSWRELIN